MAKTRSYFLIITPFVVFFTVKSQAQEKFTAYFEPSIEFSYQISPNYSHSFEVENRNIVYRQGEMDYHVKQIDLSHLSEFQVHPEYALGFGLQYRIEQTFDSDEENEFRFKEQIVYTPKNSNYNIKHRFKVEQRFYASETKHRMRYRLGYTFPLSEEKSSQPYLKADTESLLELANSQKPEFEQRVGVAMGWSINSKTKLEVGAEYQLEDYTQDLIHEIFLLMNLGITL